MADQDQKKADQALAGEVRGITEPARSFPDNPKRVIRTYATDVAKLTGAPATPVLPSLPTSPKPPPRPLARPVPASLSDTVSNINLIDANPPTPHLPPLIKREPVTGITPREEPRTSPPLEWERMVEKKEPDFFSKLFAFLLGQKASGSGQRSGIPAPAPLWQKPSGPSVGEQGAPSFKPETDIADEAREREAVLARLRSRVSTYQEQNVPPPPVFPSPRPEPFAQTRRPYVPPPTSAPEPEAPERLHTYTDDFSNRIDSEGASAFSVYAAQADSGGAATPSAEPKKQNYGLAYALLAVILFVGGSLLIYFGYTYFKGTEPVAVVPNAPVTLITGEEETTVTGTGAALMRNLAEEAGKPLSVGSIRIVYLAVATSTEAGGALIRALALPAPDILLRNIGENSTVGVIHAGDESRVFFVLSATSYERTFAGMLSWEASMGSDLALLYPPYPVPIVPVATIATTTKSKTAPPPLVPTPRAQPRFVDEVVASHDVRAFKDAEGKTILLYAYRDQQTLIIARDETTLSVLLARLSATRTQ
jgi:hypothetical protein